MKPVDSTIQRLGREVLDGRTPSRGDLLQCAQLAAEQHYELLYWANQVRTKHFADTVRLCSIAAGRVGACSEDCKWCAQSAAFAPGRTEPELAAAGDLASAARDAAAKHAASFGIVNSGRRPTADEFQVVLDAAGQIRRKCGREIRICASLGELTAQQAADLAAAGVGRYNHNLETSRRMYGQMVTTHAYDDRLATARIAMQAGMGLCCGGIFGLGETWEDRIDLAVTLRDDLQPQPEVVPLNFLHPIPGTPLADNEPLKPTEILDIIAIYRLAMPQADIKVAGGREVNLRDMQSWMFYAGATSCLIGNYLTTPGRSAEEDLRMIRDLGLRIVDEF